MATGTHARATLRTKLLAALLGVLVSIVLLELAARQLLPQELAGGIFVDERNAVFAYHEELGWFPVPNRTRTYDRSRPITAHHNSLGFRDRELTPSDKPRMLFVGDSFVWGFDVEEDERFTNLLVDQMPEWDIRNIGISAYGNDQELMLLRRFGERFRPAHVFLMFCTSTDRIDNTSNVTPFGYYKPYYSVEAGELVLHGVPVPKSVNFALQLGVFRDSSLARLLWLFRGSAGRDKVTVADPTHDLVDAIRRYSERELHAGFTVGITAPDPGLELHCRRTGLTCLDLSNHLRYPGFGRHWTPEGNRWVADRIAAHFAGRDPAPESAARP